MQIVDIAKMDLMKDRDLLESIKGTCTCSPYSSTDTSYCLEMHTPKRPLLAKLVQYIYHGYQYDYLFYDASQNFSNGGLK